MSATRNVAERSRGNRSRAAREAAVRRAEPGGVTFQILGPLEVLAGRQPIALGGPRQRLVLAHLLLRANLVVATDVLIDEVWGEDPPEAARASLHSYISHLRKALGPDRLVGRPPGYVLRASDEDVDATRFEGLIRLARGRLATDPSAASKGLRDALALWNGEPFADLAGELSLRPEIDRLNEIRLAATEDLIDAELATGRHADALPELDRLVARHPLRERLYGQLMLALYRAGRQAEALAAYHRLRGALDDELGVDPSPAIESLQHRILIHDPSLSLQGEALRGYRLTDLISSTPWSRIHRAAAPQTGRDVAIRILGPAIANERGFVRRFDAEASRIHRLEHPHIVGLYDWWREPDAAYLVTRLMRGGTLADRLSSGPVGSAETLAWTEQIGSALGAAHRMGIAHGDVRAGNVMLDEEGNAYLADFAVGFDAPFGTATARRDSACLAPERANGGPPSTAADIFAFGALILELLDSVGLSVPDVDRPSALQLAAAPIPDDRPRSAADLVDAVRRLMLTPKLDDTVPDRPTGPPRNPFKGLRAFEEADSGDFVGREDLVARLVDHLAEPDEAPGLLVVVGPSGSGKSSLMLAGLVPALRGGVVAGSDQWLVASMTPSHRPFEQLEHALLSVAVNMPARLGELLEAGDGLRPAIERVLPASAELLLIIDQFEELFTLADEPVRDRFLSTIVQSVHDSSSRVRMVIALRADFYDRALRHEGFGHLCATRTFAIPPLGPEELERVIQEPAERVGLQVEPGLVPRMTAEMNHQPGGLPLLQYALTELWERRAGWQLSIAAYEESGGVAGAIGRRAEHLVSQLDAGGVEAARQLFLRLVEPGEGAPDTSRRIRAGDLQALTGDSRVMDAVSESFARYRLLLFDRDAESREPTIELAHEALLHAWPRLAGWIDEARDDLRFERRLAAAAAQWDESGQDPSFLLTGARLEQVDQWISTSRVTIGTAEGEYLAASLAERERAEAEEFARRAREVTLERRAASRLRVLVVVLGVGALLASSLSLFAFGEGQRAVRETRVATAREFAAAAGANLDVDPERSIHLALAAVDETRLADGDVLREAQEALHQAVVGSRAVLTVPDEGGYADWAESADLGSVFVTQGVEESGIVNVRDATTGEVRRSWRADEVDVNDVAFSGTGSILATTGDDGHLKLWDPAPATPVELARWGEPSARQVWGPSFSADGELVAAAWLDQDIVRVFDVVTHDEVLEVKGLADPWKTSLSPDGARLAIALQGEHTAIVIDLVTGDTLLRLGGHQAGLWDVAWSPDGRWLATASVDGIARIFDGLDEEPMFALRHDVEIFDLDWSPDSGLLLTAGLDGVAKLWEISDLGGNELMAFSSQELGGGVGGVAFSPSGDRILTAQFIDAAVKIWDLTIDGSAEWRNVPANPAGYPGLAFPSDGTLVAASGEGTVTAWDVEDGQPLSTIEHDSDLVFDVDVNADGSLAASAGFDGTRVWETAGGRLRFSVTPDELESGSWMQAVAWSPVEDLLAAGSVHGPARIVDAMGTTIRVFEHVPGSGVNAVAFSPNGRLLATALKQSPDERWDPAAHRVIIWDWRRGTVVTTIQTSSHGLAFDPSGERLATSSVEEGQAGIWDVETGASLATLRGHSGGVEDVSWHPDPEQDQLATASRDGTVRIWDASTGVTELVLRGHAGPVWQVAFGPDGTRIASASHDGTVRVWALEIDDLIGIAREKLTRELTPAECLEFLHLEACH